MASAANKFADTGFLIDIFLAGGQKALDARSEIAPSRCEIKPRATRGSNTTGQRQVGIFFAPSRLTARSPALLPISAGSRRSAAKMALAKS